VFSPKNGADQNCVYRDPLIRYASRPIQQNHHCQRVIGESTFGGPLKIAHHVSGSSHARRETGPAKGRLKSPRLEQYEYRQNYQYPDV
jgi:hypothetical protein